MLRKTRSFIAVSTLACMITGGVVVGGQAEAASEVWKPTKPVTIICPYGAGGGQDIAARILAKYAEKYAGQKFIVENRTGGSGIIGTTAIMNAKPDGYTLGMFHSLSFYDQYLVPGVTYTEKSFVQLAVFTADTTVVVVNKKLGVTNIKQLVDKAKAAPGRITWCGPEFSAQTYPRINVENATGVKFSKMIFDGGAKALVAVAGGNCDVTSVFPSEYAAMADNPDVVPIATGGTSRIAAFPKIPTMIEQGVDASFFQSRSFVAPVGVSDGVVAFYGDLFKKAIADKDFQNDLAKSGFNLVSVAGKKEATDYMIKEYEKNKDSIISAAKQQKP